MGTPLSPTPDSGLAQFLDVLDVAFDAQDEFLFRHLDGASADFAVAPLDGHLDLRERQVVGAQLHRVHGHLVLLYEAADRGDFRDALDRRELILEMPVLHGAQFLEVVLGRS